MTDDSLSQTGRLGLLQEVYRGQFGQDFDAAMFRADQFYAAQVLERSLRDGNADLQELARPMEEQLLSNMDVEVIDINGFGKHGEDSYAAAAKVLQPLPVLATESDNPAIGEERRRISAGAGHVQLTSREALILAQLRIQYRKTFGMFFDILEFTGNDLYARTLLKLCVNSGSQPLIMLAREFMTEQDMPRLHRRKGAADLEIAFH